ncbi:lipase secretion chaperone [Burkholderia pseudomultivorans]|uniref:Lipase helper protein n=1 Tax=Burkholderia pseudomultivorans TaxID=1207504 RepID=A0ABU2EEX0_9BURK|nr:lipase secretion chaperone [Burkholderia pseudomultivorans]MDR8726083.1 Lipase chaperone [Burkholderia pseudomultivorans]MDR8735021.1 Lipase chaperone [Burkholderia pseudomultivorans]MDR8741158.1 Lipase chaperone [Burkholderia pseudomultivorans]MDR8758073.1 Lipase chaperone [Burkholderia pseudomultivorans]MDR8777401.1 Lipase chaperone [Burkholderia pseudomultivorans]
MTVRTMLSRVALHGAVGTLAAAAVWHALDRPAASTQAVALPAARAVVPDAAVSRPVPASSDAAPPASLAGSRAPRLPLGPDGRLAKLRAVRDFFDYFLLAQHDLAPAALDALVAREVAAQPIGAPAQREALDLWPRYRACLAALDAQPGTVQPGTHIDPDAIGGELERRAALASRWLGDWSTPFFADEFRQQHDDLDRLRIARDPALSDAQKRERLAALDQALPPDIRDAHERLARQRDAVATVARLDAQRATPDALRAQLGADVAARVVRQRQDDDAWQARYREYEAERERLVAQQLAPDARDAQLAQLLQRDFPDPADALRAASLGADRADITARQRAR